MTNEVTVRLRIDPGNTDAASTAVATSLGKIGTAGQISARQTAAAMRQLPAQFTDIATQLAGGQNPLLILLQQGGQIKDSFGGIGNAIRGVVSAIGPAGLALAPIAAIIGTLASAAVSGVNDVSKLRDTLALTGNAAGLTEDRLGALADRISSTTGQTAGQVRELILDLVATGQVGQQTLESVGTAVARIADLTGKSTSEIAGKFVNQLREPSRVAADLNRQYNFLDVATARRIRALENEGRAADAANLTNQTLTKSFSAQREQLGYLEQSWDAVTKSVSQFWQAIKSIGRDNTTQEAIAASRKRLDEYAAQLQDNVSRGRGESVFAGQEPINRRLREQIRVEAQRLQSLQEQLRKDEAAADAAAKRAADSSRVTGILTDKPARTREARKDRVLPPEFDATSVAAAQALANTDSARINSLTTALQGLFELQRETRGAPAVAEAIKTVRSELDRLADVLPGPVISDTAEIAKQNFLRSEKESYGQIDDYLEKQKERAAKAAQDIAERMRNNIQDGLGNTFTQLFSGEFDSIGDLWKSLISRMVAEALAADITAALFGKDKEGKSGGNTTGLFASLFNAFGSLFGGGRASGGPVERGRIYEVNENGVGEMFNAGGRQFLLAAQSGTISPAGGGMSVSLSPQISIDARSDQGQIAQIVNGAMAESERRLWAQLRARGTV